MDIRKRASHPADLLLQPLSSLRLPRKRIQFHEILDYYIVSQLQAPLVDYVFDERLNHVLGVIICHWPLSSLRDQPMVSSQAERERQQKDPEDQRVGSDPQYDRQCPG